MSWRKRLVKEGKVWRRAEEGSRNLMTVVFTLWAILALTGCSEAGVSPRTRHSTPHNLVHCLLEALDSFQGIMQSSQRRSNFLSCVYLSLGASGLNLLHLELSLCVWGFSFSVRGQPKSGILDQCLVRSPWPLGTYCMMSNDFIPMLTDIYHIPSVLI